MKIAIFASGNGSNFQVLAEAVQNGSIPAELVFLFCDKPNAYVIERAVALNVPTITFSPKDFDNKAEYEQKILCWLRDKEIDLVVLAGYMRILGSALVDAYQDRIINIHPSLLPNFPGLHGIKDAFEAGVAETGVTIHYVDNGVDTGPIIAQEKVAITPDDTLETLETKIHQVEHRLYPQVIAEVVRKSE